MWRLIDEEGVSNLCGAPAVLTTLVNAEEAHEVTNLMIATAGAPPSPTVIGACEDLGIDIIHVYGLTETYGPTVACAPQPAWKELSTAERTKLKSRQGIAMVTSEEVRVVEQIQKHSPEDVQLVDVPADGATMGEVVMRGNVVMREYFHNPDATAEAFAGGWFHSGDLAVKHPDGYIQILDRDKDVVISGGENISTIEVEQAIISHPAIADVAVIGIPDDKWGEALRAFVVLASGNQEDVNVKTSVIDHCRGLVAGFKVPRDYRIIDELPRTSTGKVKKNELREWDS